MPEPPEERFWEDLHTAWSADTIEPVSSKWTPEQIQISFRTLPCRAPHWLAGRIKGRLDHALRKAAVPTAFRRNFSLRALGENDLQTVLHYIATQHDRTDLADPGYIDTLRNASWENPAFNSEKPSTSSHARYWLDYHVVLVTNDRWRMGRRDEERLCREELLEWSDGMAAKARQGKETVSAGIRSLAVMHDHLHLLCRGLPTQSPQDLCEDLWRRLNRRVGCRLFSERVYVGSVSTYTLSAVKKSSSSDF